MQTGFYYNISNADYHGGEGISNSGLALIQRSPLHFRAKKIAANDNEPSVPTAAQRIGTAFHAMILEPASFVQDYCLEMRKSEFPHAVFERDELVRKAEAINVTREAALVGGVGGADELKAMIVELNKTRLPKLTTSGGKPELIERILGAAPLGGSFDPARLEAMKGPELKAIIESMNEHRPGQLSTSGSSAELTARLRSAGVDFFTRQEVIEEYKKTEGREFFIDAKGSMQEIAESLRADGDPVVLFTDIKGEWLRNNGHRIVLEQSEWDQLHRMRDALMAHPAACKLVTGKGHAEVSGYWIDEATGELCRFRPDYLRDDDILVDLKTTDDASEEGFASSIAKWSYDTQDAYYCDGFKAVTGRDLLAFVFVVVEKSACLVEGKPKGVAVYRMDDASREIGRAKYRAALTMYAYCMKENYWPCYSDKVETISLPQWNLRKYGHLVE